MQFIEVLDFFIYFTVVVSILITFNSVNRIFSDPILQTAFEIGSRLNIALSCVCESILFLALNPTITKVGVDSPLFLKSKVQFIVCDYIFSETIRSM